MLPFHYAIQAEIRSDCLHVRAEGHAQPSDVILMYEAIAARISEATVTRVLIVATDMVLDYGPDKVLELTAKVGEMLPPVRLARLVDPADYKNDLIETFAHQKALYIKSFSEYDKAMTWLMEPVEIAS